MSNIKALEILNILRTDSNLKYVRTPSWTIPHSDLEESIEQLEILEKHLEYVYNLSETPDDFTKICCDYQKVEPLEPLNKTIFGKAQYLYECSKCGQQLISATLKE